MACGSLQALRCSERTGDREQDGVRRLRRATPGALDGVRRWLTDHTGRWRPISADGIDLFNPEAIPITRYRYRNNKIPNPWTQAA